ncbi:MAG: hypothetical protein KDE27_05770 [Planctomycetes bacterium]|nr:hypothetical protein [Planctomycetota bacterium]
MKSILTIVASSVLAFALTYWLVPPRPPTLLPPSWFELPGSPQAVDGKPVRDWQQANAELQRIMKTWYLEEYLVEHRDQREMPVEIEARPVRITYVPRTRVGGAGEPGVATVEVRPILPITILYTRGPYERVARYEVVRSESVE